MKKIVLIFLAGILLFFGMPIKIASAAESKEYYAKIQSPSVMFYALASEESALFKLPYSYFVRVSGVEGEFYRATFKNKDGYVKKSEVSLMSGKPQTPFPSAQFRLFEPHYLFAEPNKQNVVTALDDEASLTYYGDIDGEELKYDNSLWVFASLESESGRQFGYVYSIFIDRLPHLETNLEVFEVVDESALTASSNFSGLSTGTQILLIVAISVPSIMILFFLIKPARIMQTQHKKRAKRQKNKVSHGDYFEFDESEL